MPKPAVKILTRIKINKPVIQAIIISLFAFLLFLFPSPNYYFKPVANSGGMELIKEYILPSPPAVPVNSTGQNAPILTAEGILVKDLDSGIVLYGKNENKRFSPASTTKIMTAIVALEMFKPEHIMTAKSIVSDGRKMGLVPNERLTFEALLYGMLIHSANDAAYTIGENYPGGVSAFVKRMNEKAREMYLENTSFTNTIGFDDPRHYTTAVELAHQAEYALRNDLFAKIVSTKNTTVTDISYTTYHRLDNVNILLGKIPGVSGVKTGFTQNAGEVLVTEVKKDNHRILLVVLRSHDRFGETAKLIDWVYNNYVWSDINSLTVLTTQAQ